MAKGYSLIPGITSTGTLNNGYVFQNGVMTIGGNYILCAASILGAYYNFKAYSGSTLYYYVVEFHTSNAFVYITVGSDASTNASRTQINSSGSYLDVTFKYSASPSSGYGVTAIEAYEPYDSLNEAIADILSESYSTIQYISGASVVAGPKLVANGSEVTAYVTSPRGVTVTDSDISITKNGVTVPFTYSNGVLTFTA